jgi:hypothetical protein
MSLLRIPFILSAALGMHIAATAPNPPPEATEQVKPTGVEHLFAKTMPWTPLVAKVHANFPSYHNLLSKTHYSRLSIGFGLSSRLL